MRETGDAGCDNDNVSPTPAQKARAAAIAAEIAGRLAGAAFALPGTLADRMTRCGYPAAAATPNPRSRTAPTTSGPARRTARPQPGSCPTSSSPTTAPGSTTTNGSANSSPNSKKSASPSPKPTPAGTASQTRRPPHGQLRNRNSSLQITWAELANLWAAPHPQHIEPGQTQT